MEIYDGVIWGVIIGLALMCIGGLAMWAYGARRPVTAVSPATPPDTAMAEQHHFHRRVARLFVVYGAILLGAGLIVLVTAFVKLL